MKRYVFLALGTARHGTLLDSSFSDKGARGYPLGVSYLLNWRSCGVYGKEVPPRRPHLPATPPLPDAEEVPFWTATVGRHCACYDPHMDTAKFCALLPSAPISLPGNLPPHILDPLYSPLHSAVYPRRNK